MIQEMKQLTIPEFRTPTQLLLEKQDLKVKRLILKLSLCGKYATKNWYCKKDPNNVHLLKTTRSKFHCETRYCGHVDCLVQRFARQVETFGEIKRFDGLRSLWHFAIGFEPIPVEEFKSNFSEIKKRQEYILNRYFEKLKKKGIHIQAIRVLDFSFKTEGMVYMHYHFGALPVGQNRIRSVLITMQDIRKTTNSRMRVKTPFHLQSFGLASKKAVFSYLSIRASGMYKYDMTKNPNYRHLKIGNLRESIKLGKYYLLKDLLSPRDYVKSFYNKSHFVTIGGLPRPPRHGSNITDDIPLECPIHGALERKDLRLEIIFEVEPVVPPPPPPNEPPLVIEYVKI